MRTIDFSKVERTFLKEDFLLKQDGHVPYIVVDNFPLLGFLTALRFLEWVCENPEGVISLPTGKTPEYFILWTAYLLKNWDNSKGKKMRDKYGLGISKKPALGRLRFVQMDEFYPINPAQQNSFCHYVKHFYIKGFELDAARALFIDSGKIILAEGKHYSEVFPDSKVDLSLRYREPKNSLEQLQQQSILKIDNWCLDYETRIREGGGIGFFLGGIGPDGHIAFNTRGSDHYSTTRLTETNFETQAVAASDLGGIEISRNRLVITIGLGTIAYNPDATAIVFAAGESKSPVVRDALEHPPSNHYPATVLANMKNARFYLTEGSASMLKSSIENYYEANTWNEEKTCRAVIDLCIKLDKYAHHLNLSDLKADDYCRKIPGLNDQTVQGVIDTVVRKIDKGMQGESNQVYYHTGPHHDDIMLGILPHIHRLLRNETNKASFTVLTSGFTAVTNRFILQVLEDSRKFLESGLIQMTEYPDFFDAGYKYKRDKDVYHYLIKVASGEPLELRRGLSHRIVRAIVEIYKVKNKEELRNQINDILALLRKSFDGEKNPSKIQQLKGRIREFEEELVWAYFGIQTKNVHHLRLGFYTGDIFTEQPNRDRDVKPILEQLRTIDPTVNSLAFDPEGSGPDTHYKVLQVLAEALRMWQEEKDLSNLRIWGYRNVWYRFHPAEANVIVPVSLNAMSVLDKAFSNSYLSQVEASFPSYQYDGKFSDLIKKIWVDQLKTIQLVLGKNFFYEHKSPRIRATHGLLYFREMKLEDFLHHARKLEESMEGFAGKKPMDKNM
ncbi:MAG: glucosamine-6-phosphate isomerase [Flavobacteriaceae bacterium]|nr:glucosamine-6-phosphate isomerase [Eudoraea sp.]NNJ38766.1 glucosamine-6-phosphate isomerase [Flavobacteriaceae bacterium]